VVEGNIITRSSTQYYVSVDGSAEPKRIDFSDVDEIVLNAQTTIKTSVQKAVSSAAPKKL
jgi:hypothetical protein